MHSCSQMLFTSGAPHRLRLRQESCSRAHCLPHTCMREQPHSVSACHAVHAAKQDAVPSLPCTCLIAAPKNSPCLPHLPAGSRAVCCPPGDRPRGGLPLAAAPLLPGDGAVSAAGRARSAGRLRCSPGRPAAAEPAAPAGGQSRARDHGDPQVGLLRGHASSRQ